MPLSPNAIKILEARYLRKDENGKIIETPEELFRRVANDIAKAEESYDIHPDEQRKIASQFFDMMNESLFLPNSPCLMNAGTGNQMGFSACYVIPVPDTMEGIFGALRAQGLIQKSGGGTGMSFSRLRPDGDIVKKTSGVSSGPLSFMKLFDTVTEVVKQGGKRRGANMAILSVEHPNIRDFIASKDPGNTILKNFNISVAITDDFMATLEADEYYNLRNPRTGEIVGKELASEIFDLICRHAWLTGDPGIFFIDRINRLEPLDELVESSNPCLAKGTKIATPFGWRNVEDIQKGDEIITVQGRGKVESIEENFDSELYEVVLSDGTSLKATKEHQFHAIKANNKEISKVWKCIPLKELSKGDYLRVAKFKAIPENKLEPICGFLDRDAGFLIGILLGDGCYTPKVVKRGHVNISFGTDKGETEWMEVVKKFLESHDFSPKVYSYEKTPSKLYFGGSAGREIVSESKLVPTKSPQKFIPEDYINSNIHFLRGLIDGIVSTDGNIHISESIPVIRIGSTSKELLTGIRRIFLMFGIHSRIYKVRDRGEMSIEGRDVRVHSYYALNILGDNIRTFCEEFTVSHPSKQKRMDYMVRNMLLSGNTLTTTIKSINKLEKKDVSYDLYEPLTDTWVADGIVSRGCGEQPLTAWEPCVLGSINVGKFVLPDGKVDWDHLRKIVHLAVRFLDNCIDRSPYALPQITRKAKQTRRIGLGIMGFADYLVKQNIPYDNNKAIDAASELAQFLQEEALKTSIDLAQNRSPFPFWKKSSYKDKKEEEAPRNVARTTIAPTGSISRIAGCSSGIEPYFALAYKSHVLDGQTLIDRVSLVEDISKQKGRSDWNEEDWSNIANNGGSIQEMGLPKEVKDLFKTALEIPVEQHVKMQATFQKNIDNAVSKTINLPHSATVEDVKKAYLLAWELGTKGITVYRDSSKTVQVLETSQARRTQPLNLVADSDDMVKMAKVGPQSKGENNELAKAPDVLPAERIRVETGHGTLFITISYDPTTRKPLEVFIWQGRSGSCNLAYLEALGRILSIGLRSGVPVESFIEQLRGERCQHAGPHDGRMILSIPDAVGQALVEFMEGQGNHVKSGTISIGQCPECGELLIFEEGCERCVACSYNRCG